MSMVEEKHYAVDQEKLKEYFPVDVVTGNWSLRLYTGVLITIFRVSLKLCCGFI